MPSAWHKNSWDQTGWVSLTPAQHPKGFISETEKKWDMFPGMATLSSGSSPFFADSLVVRSQEMNCSNWQMMHNRSIWHREGNERLLAEHSAATLCMHVVSWNVCGISQTLLEASIEKLEMEGHDFDCLFIQEYGRSKKLRDVGLPSGHTLIMGKR
eukprot:992283-Karenia_brevis.AAC.1